MVSWKFIKTAQQALQGTPSGVSFVLQIKAKAFMIYPKFSLRAGENGQSRKGRDTLAGVCGRAGGEKQWQKAGSRKNLTAGMH